MKRPILVAAVLAAAALLPAAPALAQGREFCVANLPYPPVPPATQSRLVIYQAYAVPKVGQGSTVFEYHAQLQNQSSGTIRVAVNVANLTVPPGGRFSAPPQVIRLTSYQPTDVVIATLTVNSQTNTAPVDPWTVVETLVRSCPFSR